MTRKGAEKYLQRVATWAWWGGAHVTPVNRHHRRTTAVIFPQPLVGASGGKIRHWVVGAVGGLRPASVMARRRQERKVVKVFMTVAAMNFILLDTQRKLKLRVYSLKVPLKSTQPNTTRMEYKVSLRMAILLRHERGSPAFPT